MTATNPLPHASPSAQALSDYQDGLTHHDNPYPPHTPHFRIYQQAMDIYLGTEEKADLQKDKISL